MKAPREATVLAASRWTLRLALFAIAIVITAAVLHRLAGMATSTALVLLGLGFLTAGLALALAGLAVLQLWRRSSLGTARTLVGSVLALSLFAWPAAYAPAYLELPRINDVSTDLSAVPQFSVLKGHRGRPEAEMRRLGELQKRAYGDLQSFVIDRSAADAFDLVADTVRRLRMTIVSEEPPFGRQGVYGIIEAVDRTLVLGFYDDIVIRVAGDVRQSRIDVRSASRVGQHDFGRNAYRIRQLLKELQARLDATVPGAFGDRLARRRGNKLAVPKRQPGGDPKSTVRRSGQDPSRSDAKRGPLPKATLPAPDARQSKGKRAPQFE
jgi:hypothetical protein